MSLRYCLEKVDGHAMLVTIRPVILRMCTRDKAILGTMTNYHDPQAVLVLKDYPQCITHCKVPLFWPH